MSTDSTLHVDLGDRSYPIRIGVDLGPDCFDEVDEGQRVLLVSDDHVNALYGDAWEERLSASGLQVSRETVPAGEPSKGLEMASRLYDSAASAGLDRQAFVVALGGGVVGDLAGFVAATYLRGLRLIQVPTSLLAMVDSSVGGKTGVNLGAGKNLVGVFYQPVEVIADLKTLSSLPEREYVAGLAEVVKYGVIWDAELFSSLEQNLDAILSRDLDVLASVVRRSCEIKAEVVAVDERESGVRAILNYGHTLGHAIEQVSGYSGWRHGEAISMGMVYASELSKAMKQFPEEDASRIAELLQRCGLPVRPADAGFPGGWEALRRAISSDKKSQKQIPRFVLAENVGAVRFGCEVPEDVLEATYQKLFG
jgi:3-dehydroquinate synthase